MVEILKVYSKDMVYPINNNYLKILIRKVIEKNVKELYKGRLDLLVKVYKMKEVVSIYIHLLDVWNIHNDIKIIYSYRVDIRVLCNIDIIGDDFVVIVILKLSYFDNKIENFVLENIKGEMKKDLVKVLKKNICYRNII